MSPEQAALVVQGGGSGGSYPAEESVLSQGVGVNDATMGRDDFTAVAKLGGCGFEFAEKGSSNFVLSFFSFLYFPSVRPVLRADGEAGEAGHWSGTGESRAGNCWQTLKYLWQLIAIHTYG